MQRLSFTSRLRVVCAGGGQHVGGDGMSYTIQPRLACCCFNTQNLDHYILSAQEGLIRIPVELRNTGRDDSLCNKERKDLKEPPIYKKENISPTAEICDGKGEWFDFLNQKDQPIDKNVQKTEPSSASSSVKHQVTFSQPTPSHTIPITPFQWPDHRSETKIPVSMSNIKIDTKITPPTANADARTVNVKLEHQPHGLRTFENDWPSDKSLRALELNRRSEFIREKVKRNEDWDSYKHPPPNPDNVNLVNTVISQLKSEFLKKAIAAGVTNLIFNEPGDYENFVKPVSQVHVSDLLGINGAVEQHFALLYNEDSSVKSSEERKLHLLALCSVTGFILDKEYDKFIVDSSQHFRRLYVFDKVSEQMFMRPILPMFTIAPSVKTKKDAIIKCYHMFHNYFAPVAEHSTMICDIDGEEMPPLNKERYKFRLKCMCMLATAWLIDWLDGTTEWFQNKMQLYYKNPGKSLKGTEKATVMMRYSMIERLPFSRLFQLLWMHVLSTIVKFDLDFIDLSDDECKKYCTGKFSPATTCEIMGIKVSWVRRRGEELHLLTVGIQTYASDSRFEMDHQKPNDWCLRIRSSNERDGGVYECQVTVHPPLTRTVHLSVSVPKVEIVDEHGATASDKFYKAGSTIELKCVVSKVPNPSGYVTWRHGSRMLNYDTTRGGISVKTDMGSGGAVSRLYIANANKKDSGNYSCSLANVAATTISVHVLNGENPAAMQHGGSEALRAGFVLVALLTSASLLR